MTTVTATQVWRSMLKDLLEKGTPVEQDSAGAAWRGRTSYELLGYQTVWPMSKPIVLCPERFPGGRGLRFTVAEAAWVLSGSNRLDQIAPFAKSLRDLSDDGIFLHGAYGPRFVEDLPYVVGTLARDLGTRQAVSVIWRSRPAPARDIPCTLSLQWLIRKTNGRNVIHCVASMRSSDAWMGLPHDVHTFAMCSAYVALLLRDKIGPLDLGQLMITAGSQHLYQMDRDLAERCAWKLVEPSEVLPAGDHLPKGIDAIDLYHEGRRIQIAANESAASGYTARIERTDEAFEVATIDLDRFAKPDDLIKHLWAVAYSGTLASGKPAPLGLGHVVDHGWLSEAVR